MEPSRILYGPETPLPMFASSFILDRLIIFELGISLPSRRGREEEGPLIPFLIPFLKAVRKANRIDANRIWPPCIYMCLLFHRLSFIWISSLFDSLLTMLGSQWFPLMIPGLSPFHS